MRSLVFIFLVIGSLIFLVGCSDESALSPDFSHGDQAERSLAKKPAPNFTGEATAWFGFHSVDPDIYWKGTIKFGDDEYGIYFISHESSKDYSQSYPFTEDFIIHDLNDVEMVYAKGLLSGLVVYANKVPEPVMFHTNGKIDEACGPFEMWEGRNIHQKGEVIYTEPFNGLPLVAISTIRIN